MAVNEKFEDVVQIELNAADTTLLMKIPGIGPVFAKAIIDYRDRLGGYYSSGQIREISFIPDSVIEKIQPWFIIDTLLINHLKINELSVAAMKRHPYLNYYQARVFYDIRRERGTVRDFEDIVFMEEFSDADIDRIKHYVKF